jgi:hypothetical protein
MRLGEFLDREEWHRRIEAEIVLRDALTEQGRADEIVPGKFLDDAEGSS